MLDTQKSIHNHRVHLFIPQKVNPRSRSIKCKKKLAKREKDRKKRVRVIYETRKVLTGNSKINGLSIQKSCVIIVCCRHTNRMAKEPPCDT